MKNTTRLIILGLLGFSIFNIFLYGTKTFNIFIVGNCFILLTTIGVIFGLNVAKCLYGEE